MIHRLERRGGRETAAEDRDQPLVGVGQTVLRQVTDFKAHVDLDGFSCWWFVSSHGVLLGESQETAQFHYRTATVRREIPGRSWRATARVGGWSRTLTVVWQYCRRGDRATLRHPFLPSSFEDLLDERQYLVILYAAGDLLEQDVVPNPIEKLR
jgi:hypothetical protein